MGNKKCTLGVSIVINNDDNDQIKNLIKKITSIKFDYKIVVLDNSRHERDFLKFNNKIKYIFNGKHIGYAKGHNTAISETIQSTNFHLISNVDLDFNHKILESMIEHLLENQNIDLMGPKIINSDGTIYNSLRFFPRPHHLIIRKFFNNFFNKFTSDYIINNSNIDKPVEGNFISGCFLLCRSKSLREINMFDDNYFLFNDDLDLCRKFKKKHLILYEPKFQIIHNHGRVHKGNLMLTLLSIKSSFYYFQKWGWFFDNERKLFNTNLKNELSEILK